MRRDERRTVDEVDRSVGELAGGEVAVGEPSGGHERLVLDRAAVVRLVALAQAAEDRDRVGDGRLVDLHDGEAALEGRVLLDVLAVLLEGGRADAPKLAAGERRLEEVAGVHAAAAVLAGEQEVHLVDEEAARSVVASGGGGARRVVGLLELGEDRLHALFKLAFVAGAGVQSTEVKAPEWADERRRNVAAARSDIRRVRSTHLTIRCASPSAIALCGVSAFALEDIARLADTGWTDQDWVRLGAAREHADRATNLSVAADDRCAVSAWASSRLTHGRACPRRRGR